MPSLRAPEAIHVEHDLTSFDCAQPTLNDWIRRRALRNESSGASRTYVVCAERGNRVVAYYCLAAGAVAQIQASAKIRRNMPDPIPVMVIGRLAVDRSLHGQGIGKGLLRDAILRVLQASRIVGIRATLVHAISHEARQFYERCGFQASPIDPMVLMMSIKEAEHALTIG